MSVFSRLRPGRGPDDKGSARYLSASVAAERQTQSRRDTRRTRRGGDTMGRGSRNPGSDGEEFRLRDRGDAKPRRRGWLRG